MVSSGTLARLFWMDCFQPSVADGDESDHSDTSLGHGKNEDSLFSNFLNSSGVDGASVDEDLRSSTTGGG